MTNKTHIAQIDELVLDVVNNTPLLAGAGTYVGDPVYVNGYTHISGFVFSDVDSAANGLIIEQGLSEADFPAGTAATTSVTRSLFGITGGDMESNSFAVQIVAPWARIIYINGAAAQTEFKLYSEARILRGL